MKKKLLPIIALAVASSMLFTACAKQQSDSSNGGSTPAPNNSSEQQKPAEDQSKDQPKDQMNENDFLKKFIEQNKTLQSVRLNLDGDYDFFGEESQIKIEGLFEYDPESRENSAYYIAQLIQTPEQSAGLETVYQRPGPSYARMKDGAWATNDVNEDRIDYLGFVDILQKILLEEKYEFRENDDSYEISVKDKDFDLLRTFKGELNFTLKDIDPKVIDKSVVYVIDKESFYIEEIIIKMDHETADKKKLKTYTRLTMSDHNEVDDKEIAEIYKSITK